MSRVWNQQASSGDNVPNRGLDCVDLTVGAVANPGFHVLLLGCVSNTWGLGKKAVNCQSFVVKGHHPAKLGVLPGENMVVGLTAYKAADRYPCCMVLGLPKPDVWLIIVSLHVLHVFSQPPMHEMYGFWSLKNVRTLGHGSDSGSCPSTQTPTPSHTFASSTRRKDFDPARRDGRVLWYKVHVAVIHSAIVLENFNDSTAFPEKSSAIPCPKHCQHMK